MSAENRRSAPWQRNLWSIVVAELLTFVAFQGSFILIPYYIQEMGITDPHAVSTWTGAFQSIGAMTFAVFVPIWGVISDRYGRKVMLVRAMVATTLVLTLMGVASNPSQLLVLRVIQGIFTGTPAAASALVAAGTPKARLGYALGIVQTSILVGSSLGPFVGGYMADAFSYRATFYISAVLAGVALLLVLFGTHEPAESAEAAAQARREAPWKAFGSLLSSGAVMLLTAINLLINLIYGLLGPVLPLVIQGLAPNPDRVASVAGLLSGLFAFTAALAAMVMGRMADRIGHRRAIVASAIGLAVMYFPQAMARSILSLGVLRTIQGFFQGGMAPSYSAMVVESVPPQKTGAALGVTTSAGSIGFALGPALGAVLMNSTSSALVFVLSGMLFVVVAATMALFGPRGSHRTLPVRTP